jgi:hypothetical protein
MRHTITLIMLLSLGCAAHFTAKVSQEPPRFGGFKSADARLLACIDLQDKAVDLYLRAYQDENPGDLDGVDPVIFRKLWTDQLEHDGAFDRFEKSCFYGLTTNMYQCAMHTTSVDGLQTCLASRGEL